MKKVFLTGITGQACSYLAELLLEKNYEIHGLMRRCSNFNTQRIEKIIDKINLHYGDLSDGLNIYNLINKIKPDYIINAGAQSHVATSFEIPIYTSDITGLGVIRLLESIKQINSKIKFIQFSSSELFGKVQETPQKETTPFYPRSPYGIAKLMGYWNTINYREAYNIHPSNAIFFNMESPRRGHTFITKKIIDYVNQFDKNNMNWSKKWFKKHKLQLGNLKAKRDWGYCPEYMEGLYLMMKMNKPNDIIFATGETHTVNEFCKEAFNYIGIKNYMDYIEINPKYYRPTEVDVLIGDASKAKKILGWEAKVKFKELIKKMIKE